MQRSSSLISMTAENRTSLRRPKTLERQRSDTAAMTRRANNKKKLRRADSGDSTSSSSRSGGGNSPLHGGGLSKRKIKRSLSGVLFNS